MFGVHWSRKTSKVRFVLFIVVVSGLKLNPEIKLAAVVLISKVTLSNVSTKLSCHVIFSTDFSATFHALDSQLLILENLCHQSCGFGEAAEVV